MNGQRLPIRDDISPVELRKRARYASDRAAAARMLAIANALEGMTRADAARLAGMERQALRDAVVRYNAEGLAGLHNRPHRGPASRLTNEQHEQLRQMVLDGPDPQTSGLSAWTLSDLAHAVAARWGVTYHAGHMSKLMRKLGLSRQKARPSHPNADPAAREAFAKGGFKMNCVALPPHIPPNT